MEEFLKLVKSYGVDELLAVVALVGSVTSLGFQADAHSNATPWDVAAVTGQTGMLAGKLGGLNWLGSSNPTTKLGLVDEMTAHGAARAKWLEQKAQILAENAAIETQNMRQELQWSTSWRGWAPRILGGTPKPPDVPYKPIPPQVAPADNTQVPRNVRNEFDKSVVILSVAIMTVTAMQAPFLLHIPDEGGQLNSSNKQFTQAVDTLGSAFPDWRWISESATAYVGGVAALRGAAAQAGMDIPFLSTSLDTQLQRIVGLQAVQVELINVTFSVIIFGLTAAMAVAYLIEKITPGASFLWQSLMLSAGVGGAGAFLGLLDNWCNTNAKDINKLADQYDKLAATIPTIPVGPPRVGFAAPASTAFRSANLNLSGGPDASSWASMASGSGDEHAPLSASAGRDAGSSYGPPPPAWRTGVANASTASRQRISPPARPATHAQAEVPDEATLAEGIEGKEVAAAAGTGEAQRVPVDVASPGPNGPQRPSLA